MIRRDFLARTLGVAVASLFARNVSAQHSMHGMSGMSGMSDTDDMPGMSSMHAAHAAPKLAPETAMP
ncbi:MAG TPA: multicopper oxidase family protein, partial [Paraburkholderia sp.]|nr:multicopper oxidase family protein [Paraburkholderia sp.]